MAGPALRGALDLIAEAGGGVAGDCPHDTGGTKACASFLCSCTRTTFEMAGFTIERIKGAKNTATVAAR